MDNPKNTSIRVQTEDFDLSAEYKQLRQASPAIGAIVTFSGLVRDFNVGDDVTSLFLEHYPGMTEKVLSGICKQARQRWSINDIGVIHRIGELTPSEQIVFVGVSSAHRGDAFQACEFIMDFLKTQAPFWKKEQTLDGDRWVDARDTDSDAAERWNN